MIVQVIEQHGSLIVAGAAFVAGALAGWPLLRRAHRASPAHTPHAGPPLLATLGEIAAPVATRLCGGLVRRVVEAHIRGDAACEKLGASRVLGLALLAGVLLSATTGVLLDSYGQSAAALFAPALVYAVFGFVAFTLCTLDRERLTLIRRDLPYMVDLLSLMSLGGAVPIVALERAASIQAGTPLGFELVRTVQEMRLGTSRSHAMSELAERVPLEEVASFVDTLRRADQLGSELPATFTQFADRLRQTRIQRAESAASRAGITIMGPAALLLLAVLVLLFAPFGIKILHTGLPF